MFSCQSTLESLCLPSCQPVHIILWVGCGQGYLVECCRLICWTAMPLTTRLRNLFVRTEKQHLYPKNCSGNCSTVVDTSEYSSPLLDLPFFPFDMGEVSR